MLDRIFSAILAGLLQVSFSGPTSLCFFKNFFKNLFLAALGLRCCVWAFSSCGERGLLFIAVCGLHIAVASLVVEYGL